MPSWPMAMPSSTAMVLNSLPTPPAPLDLFDHQLTHVLQVHVSRHELREGVGDRDDGFLEVAILHAGGAPQRAGSGHIATGGAGAGTIDRHGGNSVCRRRRYFYLALRISANTI